MSDEVYQGCCYLLVGAFLEGASQVFAVDLAVPQKGAEAGVENLRGGGEGERPDLRIVPELSDAYGILRTRATSVEEEGNLGETSLDLYR